jgi:hypothetical protein
MSIDSLCNSIPTNTLLDLRPLAHLLSSVDAFVRNLWRYVARHAIHDTEEAGRRQLARSHFG